MSDKVSGRKQPSFVPRQGTSREKGTSSSDMSVYKSSAEESVRNKDRKQSSIYKSSEEYFEYSCDPCKTVGDHVEAQGYCTNCEEYLCGTCFRSHSRSKASKHHTLLDKDAMPKMTAKICDPCKTAGDEVEAAGYCKDCDEYLCDSCYKSHSRSKTSRHHVLVDKDKISEESDRAVTSSIVKMNIHTKGAGEVNYNEEYTHLRDINIKADTDEKDCYITGMTLLSDTELVLCDVNNNSLKLVDVENGIIKDVFVLQAGPLGITAISKDQVAVVLGNKHQIQIISIRGRLSVVRTIKTTGDCVDVKLNSGKLYVSFWEPVQFQILQMTGAIIKTIKPESEVLKHCAHPRHIAVSPDEGMIYVFDWKTKKVMSWI
ncbi:uncharacterized protein LOC123539370 [Mercenaria mercenaria]|uniref:uncharacterized protein LOC123539370 n=1 Tax=Mercenaria mercenaria TaxID=6596 RepID=UPI00234F4D14|nr:uncharacterized protein LOC123539370 [Mercenaria mercenaria]